MEVTRDLNCNNCVNFIRRIHYGFLVKYVEKYWQRQKAWNFTWRLYVQKELAQLHAKYSEICTQLENTNKSEIWTVTNVWILFEESTTICRKSIDNVVW